MQVPDIRFVSPNPTVYIDVLKAFSESNQSYLLLTTQSFAYMQSPGTFARHDYILISPLQVEQQAAEPQKATAQKSLLVPVSVKTGQKVDSSNDPAKPKDALKKTIDLPMTVRTVKITIQNLQIPLKAESSKDGEAKPPQIKEKPNLPFKQNFEASSPKTADKPGIFIKEPGKGESLPSTPFGKVLPQPKADMKLPAESRPAIVEAKEAHPHVEPVVVSSHAELASILHPQPVQQINLPLNFIVPFPVERKIDSPIAKSGKAAQKGNEKKGSKEEDENLQYMTLVPKGPYLLDEKNVVEIETFAIAITPVTNLQFSVWLNEHLQLKELELNGGIVRDLKGNIICLTKEQVPTSQIQMNFQNGECYFSPVRHIENHPVVHVSYFGAMAFCRSNGLRLPTELEWEKAAGMQLPKAGMEPKKFLFGCGKDEISIKLVNYRESFAEQKPLENRTTPVGFYNGEKVFARYFETVQTELASSPYGCFDMSGNVREWVAEGVAKGGSYDSSQDDLKITSRARLDIHTADAFTGFRVAY